MPILEGREIPRDLHERADAVVVGSGAGGATVAMRLAEAGWRVVVLERGGYYTGLRDPVDPARPGRGELDQREDDMLVRIDGGRGLDTSTDGRVALTYGNCVGGATVHYWADSYRTPPDRLRRWERDHGLEGYTADELGPWFDTIERDLSVTPADESLYNGCSRILRRGVQALGWHGEPVPQARRGCVRSGYCMQGCAYDAKQSMLVTYVPRAVRAGARVLADCEVRAIATEGGRVTGVEAVVLDRDRALPAGPRVRVDAPVVVLAAGGYGTAPLLLRTGLANASGQVGRHLHVNPSVMVFGRFEEEVVMWRNIPAAHGCLEWRLAREEGGRYREGGYLLMPNQLGPALLASMLPGFGADLRQRMAVAPHIGGTLAWIDDVEEGRIGLGEDGAPRVHVPIEGRNAAMLRDAMEKGARVLLAAGAREVWVPHGLGVRIVDEAGLGVLRSLDLSPGWMTFAAPHPAGACRMGRDPRTSVVASSGEAHEVRGLYVADGSMLPTAVSVDPSVTIMAFAHRIADGLLARAG